MADCQALAIEWQAVLAVIAIFDSNPLFWQI
jgi:hypothetical protein